MIFEDHAFRIEDTGPELKSFGDYGGGEARCVGSRGVQRLSSTYAYAVIGAVVNGTFDYGAPMGSIAATPGTLLFGNAREEFTYRFLDDGPVRRAVLAVRPGLLDEVADALGVQPVFGETALGPSRAGAAVYGEVRRLAAGRVRHDEDFMDLIAFALRADRRRVRDIKVADKRQVAELARRMDIEFADAWDLDRMAEATCMSRFHFIRTFRSVVGEKPRQYLIAARLRAAADRLLDSRDSVTDIAMSVGFNDISHFNLSFRSAFGRAPRAWRDER